MKLRSAACEALEEDPEEDPEDDEDPDDEDAPTALWVPVTPT
ncbi:MAG TPA: hypothetical protein VMD03_07785 [Steroidobacteraceae bacterium]|nr:hypothetical protein [Steroidobacteraceae bacterium]